MPAGGDYTPRQPCRPLSSCRQRAAQSHGMCGLHRARRSLLSLDNRGQPGTGGGSAEGDLEPGVGE